MKNRLILYFFSVVVFLFVALPVRALNVALEAGVDAQDAMVSVDGGKSFSCPALAGGASALATSADVAALIKCIETEKAEISEASMKEIKATFKKRQREEWWDQMKDKAKEAMAGAFKKSLESMARQIGKDTAVWVASGGRGQKPLFITEGWGAYVRNAGDVALGDFIDQVGQSFGVDLCEPDFNVKMAIIVGIDQRRTQQVRCSFSEIMNNWEGAISNANFSVEYRAALRPGENDVSVALMLADKRNSYVADAVEAAAKEAEIPGLWKDIKDISGYILTPGTMIHDKFSKDTNDTSKIGWDTFTGTIWDLLGSFLDTLVAQLAVNLKNGFFSSSNGISGGSSAGVPDLSSLFTPWSSPVVAGVRGAEDKFAGLKGSTMKIGGEYDLINKLSTCQDPNNLGPMDCVLDQELASAIRQRLFVKDLGNNDQSGKNSILDRPFAPFANKVENPSDHFSHRQITILRKYRIVPVGWEKAAQIANEQAAGGAIQEGVTLRSIMDKFNEAGSPYFGLIDPYWVLKAPDMFCRREGFGPQNSFSGDQDGAIYRNEYCADEQQCIKESDNGQCLAYGYCTEERKIFNFGKSCDEKYNTCNTFVNRSGQTNYWLSNTLDYRNCDQGSVGCRWMSVDYNPVSQYWIGAAEGKYYSINSGAASSVTVGNSDEWLIKEGQYVSGNQRLVMAISCSEVLCKNPALNNKCEFVTSTAGRFCKFQSGLSCDIPVGGVNCRLPICATGVDALSAGNGDFEDSNGTYTADASKWSDELSFITNNNRAYREAGAGKDNSAALRILANGTPATISLATDSFGVEKSAAYRLKFDVRGSVGSSGKVMIVVYGGEKKLSANDFSDVSVLASADISAGYNQSSWQEIRGTEFNVQDFESITIAILAPQGTFADIRLDNFSVNKIDGDCFENSVTAFSQIQAETSINDSKDIYFDRDAQTCPASAVGCSQFLRLKSGVGANLVFNGGFEYGDEYWKNYWGGGIGGTDKPIESIIDGKAKLQYSTQSYNSYFPVNVEAGGYYRVSYDAAKVDSGDNVDLKFEMIFVEKTADAGINPPTYPLHRDVIETDCASESGDGFITFVSKPSGTSLERKSCWLRVPAGAKLMMFKPYASVNGGYVYFDNLKIEKVSYPSLAATAYVPYSPEEAQGGQVSYLKRAPESFNCYYYKDGATKRWPTTPDELDSVLANRSLACSGFAGVCLSSEVGCELYKPLNGDPTVPGVANDIDACPQECAGYQVYKQESTRFVNDKYRQFIADNKAKYCSASYAGCDEFTNLDEIGKGAETKEYYSSIRACQKPGIDDAAYYTWEGSDTSGYQLKAYNLKKSGVTDNFSAPTANQGNAPCTNLSYDDSGNPVCKDVVLTNPSAEEKAAAGICSAGDLAANADCRQFYDVDGNIHYRLLSRTISVSSNCHPYRRTMTQNSVKEAEEDCKAHAGWWNSNNECIYMAIPGEGMKCPASAKGCRAYTGNRGNNVRKVIDVDNFGLQGSTTGQWIGFNAAGNETNLFVSSESTFPGGNSLTNTFNTITVSHPVSIKKGKTYTLTFWAKGSNSFSLDHIRFSGAGSDASKYFAVKRVAGDNLLSNRPVFGQDWNLYELGPVFVDWDPSDNEKLEFKLPEGGGVTGFNLYLDNVTLKEVINKTYLIENSWYTPVACDNPLDDADGSKGKSAGNCQNPEANRCSIGAMLGCAGYTNRANQKVYLKSFASLCRPEAAGCEALIDTKNNATPLAKEYHSGDRSAVMVAADEQVYLVNDSAYACSASDKGCTAYGLPIIDQQDNAVGYQSVFVKNQPDRYETDLCYGNNLWCEQYSSNGGAAYFKEPHNKICVFGSAASSTGWFKLGTVDESCPTTYNQSYGTGYGNQDKKRQPLGVVSGVTLEDEGYQGWAGACPQAQSTCSEFVDPLNEMYVGERIDGGVYSLRANTLYSISDSGHGAITVSSADCSVIPQEKTESGKSGYLYYLKRTGASNSCNVTITGNLGAVKVSKAGVYYKLAGSVDKSSCNGQVDFNNGCVLFNDRGGIDYSTTTISGRNKYLNFDSPFTYSQGISGSVGPKTARESGAVWGQSANNSDVILKVRPDRTCSQWLSCTSYIKGDGEASNEKFGEKDYCLGVSACDDLSEDNQCSHLAQTSASPLSMESNNSRLENRNKTGYSIIGMYPVDKMDYKGQGALVGNGNFEQQYKSGKPVGWNPLEKDKTWDPSQFSLVYDAKNAPEGHSYFRMNFEWTANAAKSEDIDVVAGQTYYLSAWVNTLSLKSSDNGNNEYGEILVMSASGEIGRISVRAGSDWIRKTLAFNVSGVSDVYLMIRNSPDGSGSPVGYSLFDDVQINPVLDENGASPELSKTCRVYPSSDAPACKYTSGGVNYYGWYGYCLTPDPNRKSDCLQWFPVDKIKGELTSDYALGYDNRRPLYYCVDWDIVSINISDAGVLGNIGENLGEDWKQKISSLVTDNRKVTAVAFDVNPEYAGFMKYPYINRFIFAGGFGGISEAKTSVIIPMTAFMYKNCVIGSVGLVPFFFGTCGSTAQNTTPTAEKIIRKMYFDQCFAEKLQRAASSQGTEYSYLFHYCIFNSSKLGVPAALHANSNFCFYNPNDLGKCFNNDGGGYNVIDDVSDFDGCVSKTAGVADSRGVCLNCLPGGDPANWHSDAHSGLSNGTFYNYIDVESFCSFYCRNYSCPGGEAGCKASLGGDDGPNKNFDDEIESCLDELAEGFENTDSNCDFEDGFKLTKWISCVIGKIVQKMMNIFGVIGGALWNDNEDVWGGWGAAGFTVEGIDLTPIVLPTTWYGAITAPKIGSLIQTIANVVLTVLQKGNSQIMLGFGVSGVKIITDEDSKYGSSLTDPDPASPGNVLGYGWFLNTSQMYGAGLIGSFQGYMNIPYCKTFVKTVEATGGNKAYYSRVGLGSSDFKYNVTSENMVQNDDVIEKRNVPTQVEEFSYKTDYMPYGAIVPPAGGDVDAPITWDSKTVTKINQASINLPGVSVSGVELIEPKVIGLNFSSSKQPLFFETPVLKYGAPYQSRAGGGVTEVTAGFLDNSFQKIGVYLNSVEDLKNLFAKNYSVFRWYWDSVKVYDPDWSILGSLVEHDGGEHVDRCLTVRDNALGIAKGMVCEPKQGSGGSYEEVNDPAFTWDEVAEKGKGSYVTNIKTTLISRYAGVSVFKLQFNVEANVDQLPIKSYVIVWGDGETDSISGAFLNDKPNASSTFTVYHTYDVNKMRSVAAAPGPLVSSPCCYKLGSVECSEQTSNIANNPSCSGNSCSASIFISIRDSWDKVNYCNVSDINNGAINMNSTQVTVIAD